MAGGDDKMLAELGRYDSPKAVNDARRAAALRIEKGDIRPPRPADDAPPEQLAEWRKGRGIPETHEGYKLELGEGVVVGEADKPLLESFLKSMHGKDATPAEVNRAAAWYFEQQEAQREARENADAEYRAEQEEILRKDMGADFRRNVRIVNEFLQGAPPGVAEKIMGGRDHTGRLFAADAAVISWLTNLALERNPIASVVSGSGPAAIAAMETELAGLEKMMGDQKSEYWKGPKAAANQERYRQLITAKGAQRG